MQKSFAKLISLCIILALTLSVLAIPVSAVSWDNVPDVKYASRYQTSQYASGRFYKNMTQIPLTGDGARDVVAVAASQIGYLEGDSTSGYSGEIGGSTNYTEYGYYMGLSGGSGHAWCAAFCSWCFYTAEVTDVDGYYYDTNSGNIWADTYVPDWSNYLIDQGRYKYGEAWRSSYAPSQGKYIPQSGDLVFFYTSSEDYPGWEGHIGLVAYCDGEYVYTLEGNTSSQQGVESEGGGMFFKQYALSSSNLIGFGVMPYEVDESLPAIDYTGENPTLGLYVNPTYTKSVYAEKNDDTATWYLPMASVFEVIGFEYDDNGLLMLHSKCEIDGETVYGWIVHGSDSNGQYKTLQIYANPDNEDVEVEITGTPFWVTHYNNIEAEGAGVIMTEAYSGGAWNLHVAFSPVAGTDAYEITAISDGTKAGGATALAIPEGGFVYTINKGNDWPSIYASDPDTYSYAAGYPDYTSDACNAMLDAMKSWKVGDKLVFHDIDIDAKEVPTVTPTRNWYSDYYKCTAGFTVYGEGGTDTSEPDTSEPDTSEPDTSEPDTSEPEPDPDPEPEPNPDPEPDPEPTPDGLQGAGIPGDADNIAFGCDLSFWNVNSDGYSESDADYSLVDFEKMKADGCDFVILRFGSEDADGRYYDPHFITYYNMAREAGMPVGLYFYSYSLTYADAVADAEFVIDVIEQYDMYFEYPVYIDIEESDQLALGETALSNVCYGWCDTMVENGYFPGMYGNYNLYDGVSTELLNTYDFWLAWVTSSTSVSDYNPSTHNLSDECAMWQYSFYGYEYDGIGLDMLDVNVAYKDYPALMEKYGYNNVAKANYNVISTDKTYYPMDNTRDDGYADDLSKLTDGVKGSIYGGGTARYSGWFAETVDIVLDVGTTSDYNTFSVYAAANSGWGIIAPSGLTVSVSDTLNGTYKQVASTTTVTAVETDSTTGWTTYLITVTVKPIERVAKSTSTVFDGTYNNRFVKLEIASGGEEANHIWLDEVEVAYVELEEDDVIGVLVGNINLNTDNSITPLDYMLLKRYSLGTYQLSDLANIAADINNDGSINSVDYMLLKRYCLGTYEIQ